MTIARAVHAPTPVRSLGDLGRRIAASIEQFEIAYLVFAALLFTAIGCYQDMATPLWFDEFFTLSISQLPSLRQMLAAMPCDGQPPLQDLLTRLSMDCFGHGELAVRLPELLAYTCAGLLIYKIARRHGSAVVSLCAFVLFVGSTQSRLALSARPYGLLLAFTAAVYLAWQTAILSTRRMIPLSLLAIAIAGGILSHHYALIYGMALIGAGEGTRCMLRRTIDWPIVGAVVVGMLPLAVTLPIAQQSSHLLGEAIRSSPIFWAKPALSNLSSYSDMVCVPLLVCICMAILLLSVERRPLKTEVAVDLIPVWEWAAIAALCLLLPLQILLAKVATGYFLPRYAVGTTIGLALLVAWALPRLRILRQVSEPAAAMSITVVLLFYFVAITSLALNSHPRWPLDPAAKAVPPTLYHVTGNLPIVIASAFDYAPIWWYSKPSLRKRLAYLSDAEYAEKQPQFVEELALDSGQSFIPMPVSPYAGFLKAHSQFLLYSANKPTLEWVIPRLEADGWQMKVMAKSNKDELFLVSR